MIGIELAYPAAGIDERLALAETALQPGADLADFTSGAAPSGQVPTADGLGGVAWAAPSGGTLDLAAAHAVALSF